MIGLQTGRPSSLLACAASQTEIMAGMHVTGTVASDPHILRPQSQARATPAEGTSIRHVVKCRRGIWTERHHHKVPDAGIPQADALRRGVLRAPHDDARARGEATACTRTTGHSRAVLRQSAIASGTAWGSTASCHGCQQGLVNKQDSAPPSDQVQQDVMQVLDRQLQSVHTSGMQSMRLCCNPAGFTDHPEPDKFTTAKLHEDGTQRSQVPGLPLQLPCVHVHVASHASP